MAESNPHASRANDSGSARVCWITTLKRWKNLIRCAQRSHLPIDNNPKENAIRAITIDDLIRTR